MALFSVTLSDL